MTTQDGIDAVKAAKKELADAKKAFKVKARKIWPAFVNSLFAEHPNLNCVVILGSTPSWNDGDECVHSEEIFVNDLDECAEILGEDADTCGDGKAPAWTLLNEKLPSKEATSISKALKALEGLREIIYGTNWQLRLERQDGKVKITKKDYNCGY